MSLLNAFTVDVEDYFHVSAFERHIDRSQWDQYPSRVEQNTRRLLRLMGEHQIHGTFFVLGWVARHYPDLVREIHAAGHEIGSHSYWHRLIYEQTPEQFREDLVQSRHVLEDLIGERVVSYRAPSFSITSKSLWAIDILLDEGFNIDSSIFPIVHDRYGIPGAKSGIHVIERPVGVLWEFPASVCRMAGLNLPVSGGGYFRLYPLGLTLYCLKRINRASGEPFVFYVHPWEIDPDQPRVAGPSLPSRFRHYVHLNSTLAKLGKLLSRFRFGTLTEAMAAAGNEVAGLPQLSITSGG